MPLAADSKLSLDAHYRHCEAQLRAYDRDRWLAGLFAPPALRKHVHALYAFNLEIARIRDSIANPGPGEIRMQWWVDAIEGEARGDVSAHPVAHALIDTIRNFRLPRSALTRLIEARRFDLYDDAITDMVALERYCGNTCSSLFRLTSIILARGQDPGGAEAAGYAGVAYALTGLLRAFPFHASQGRCYLPADLLARQGLTTSAAIIRPANRGLFAALAQLRALARRRHDEAKNVLSALSPEARPAFVGLATTPLYLRAMERGGYQPFSDPVFVPQWRRQWAMWRF